MTLREALRILQLVEIEIEARELELVGKFAERRKLLRAIMVLSVGNYDWDTEIAFTP